MDFISGRSHKLRDYVIIWVLLPLLLVMAAFVAARALAFERTLTELLVERQRQIASSAAVGVSEVVQGYARILKALAAHPDLLNNSRNLRSDALESAVQALGEFDLGVAVFDTSGRQTALLAGDAEEASGAIAFGELFSQVRAYEAPVFSQLMFSASSSEPYILVGMPIIDEGGVFRGALIGAARARTSSLANPIRQVKVGEDGFAYLLDGSGKVIYHRDESQIGEDYSDRSFYRQAISDDADAGIMISPNGERLVEADAPIAAAGWILIVQESWDSAAAPARRYNIVSIVLATITVLIIVIIIVQGLRRISLPIHFLDEQTDRLSRGIPMQAFSQTGIRELDDLESSFDEMARQISTYRAGVHRFIKALNQSQESERRRIARDLHDETVQNLLAISRQVEIYQRSETEPQKLERLRELQRVIGETQKGLRRIIRDLRPLILEDLGLIPALQALLRGLREGPQAVPHVHFELEGEPVPLSSEHELAFYRITQEALNNIRKHSGATGAQVKLAFRGDRVVLEIEDNGHGFQVPPSIADFSQYGHFGLMGIQERVWALGGELLIESGSRGTRLCIETPISQE